MHLPGLVAADLMWPGANAPIRPSQVGTNGGAVMLVGQQVNART